MLDPSVTGILCEKECIFNRKSHAPPTGMASLGQQRLLLCLSKSYCKQPNQLICQIESPGALEASAAIAGLPGIDGLFVGPVFWHEDKSGFLAHVTAVLACVRSNIATIRTTRRHRGSPALTAVELDSTPPSEATALLAKISHVTKLRAIPPLG